MFFNINLFNALISLFIIPPSPRSVFANMSNISIAVQEAGAEILNLNVLENHKEILKRKASKYVSNYCRRNDNKCSDAHIVNLS